MGDMAKILSVRFSETSMVIVLKAVASSAQNFLYIMILKKSIATQTKNNAMQIDTITDKSGMKLFATTIYQILLH
jgi:hypothetical protein